jgi:Ca2+-binding RTX toxin-like protein
MARNRSTSNLGDSLTFSDAPDMYDVFNVAPLARHIDDMLPTDKGADASTTDAGSPAPVSTSTSHADEVTHAPTGGVATDNASPAPATTGTTAPAPTTNAPPSTTTSSNDGTHTHTGVVLEGTDNADTLVGTRYADEIHGRGGNDLIQGGQSGDALYGDEGNDTLEGGSGNDILDGGTGNDTLRGGAGADTLIGGEGMDNVSYVLSSAGVIVDLATGGVTNDAAGDTYSGIENVFGTSYGDIINGDNQANVLHGGSGDDFVFGQGGDDRIFGDLGWDILRGGAGNDILNGGQGQDRLTGDDAGQFGYDTFVLQNGNGVDIITDFQQGYDRLDLRGYGITSFGSDGHLPVGQTWGDLYLGGGIDGGDRLVFDPYEHTLYQVTLGYDNDYGAWYVSSRHEIAVLQGVDTLSAQDIILS